MVSMFVTLPTLRREHNQRNAAPLYLFLLETQYLGSQSISGTMKFSEREVARGEILAVWNSVQRLIGRANGGIACPSNGALAARDAEGGGEQWV